MDKDTVILKMREGWSLIVGGFAGGATLSNPQNGESVDVSEAVVYELEAEGKIYGSPIAADVIVYKLAQP